MGRNLFFSYSRADADAVADLVADATSLGHDAWVDLELTGGQRWWDEILRQIRASDVFITCLSPAFVESAACEAEFTYAAALDKPIVPVLLKEGVSTSLLPPELSQVQRVDYTRSDRYSVVGLVRALGSVGEPPPLPAQLPAPPDVPATYLFDLKTTIVCTEPMDIATQDRVVEQIAKQFDAGHDPIALRSLLRLLRERPDVAVRTAEHIARLESVIPAVAPIGAARADAGDGTKPGPEVPARPIPMPDRTLRPVRPIDGSERNSRSFTPASDPVHWAWWIAPVLFATLGGLVAWLSLRQTNPRVARQMLVTGIVVTAVLAAGQM